MREPVIIPVQVQPRAGRNEVLAEGDGFRIRTTAAPEKGKANAAVRKLLAKHLGVAPSRLQFLRGQSAKTKLFKLD
ncbi:MAG: DUF167 domain-containing protein [Mangrovicoccus sp.]|nr:DUF167 domain-containing protein [Mangrovicoccus sp.]